MPLDAVPPPEPAGDAPEPPATPETAPLTVSRDEWARIKHNAEVGEGFREGFNEAVKAGRRDLAELALGILRGDVTEMPGAAPAPPEEPGSKEPPSEADQFEARILAAVDERMAQAVGTAVQPIHQQREQDKVNAEVAAAKEHYGEEFDDRWGKAKARLAENPKLAELSVTDQIVLATHTEDKVAAKAEAEAAIKKRTELSLSRFSPPPRRSHPAAAKGTTNPDGEKSKSIRQVALEAVMAQEHERLSQ